MNMNAIPMLQTKVHLTVCLTICGSFSPMYLPVRASPAYANPSVKYENIIRSFIMIELTARSRSPKPAEMVVKPIYIAMKQRERTKRSVFMTKKRRVSAPANTVLKSDSLKSENTRRAYLASRSARAVKRPEYWAATVPAAIPAKPIGLSSQLSPAGMPNASVMLINIFIPFTTNSVIIGLTLSCMPMNQPLKAIRERVAGAAQIRMKKYFDASSRTSGVQSTTRKAALTNTH